MQAALPFFIADGAQSQGQQFLRLQYGINIAGIPLRITKGSIRQCFGDAGRLYAQCVSCLCHGCRGLVQHNDMVSQTFFLQVCFCFFKGHFPTSPLLFGNGPDPCGQTSCTFNAGIRNNDHRTGRLNFIQICKHLHLQLVVVQNIALAGKVSLFPPPLQRNRYPAFRGRWRQPVPPVLRCSFYSPLSLMNRSLFDIIIKFL